MFSYRHAFHAGNHADVLKHIVLIQVLLYACRKETPFFYIDTHAGGGIYSLHGNEAGKSEEFRNGIGRLWNEKTVPDAVEKYLGLIRSMNPDGILNVYPGSPFIADAILRDNDRLRLFEMHPSEIQVLQKNIQQLARKKQAEGGVAQGRGKRTIVEKKDGFSALKSLLPPPSRRAVVLIDPPYEDKSDYRKVVDTLKDALKRFSTGTYLVWYPLLQRNESRQFAGRLRQAVSQEWLDVTLSTGSPVPDGSGFVSSGMFIVNPPWKLDVILKETMPCLVALLRKDRGARFTLETGIQGK